MDLQIHGNAALVTASSGGLGKACARRFLQEGANVVINGRSEETLAATAEELAADAAAGARVVPIAADLTDPDEVERLVAEAVDELGGLDHLVTSAGGPPSGAFLDTTDEDWLDAYDLLVMSAVRTVRHAAPHLAEGDGGTIVNITSRTVKEAAEKMVLSNAVRMSVVGLEKTVSKELAPDIRSNTVLPGSHDTERVRNLINQGVERGDFDSYDEGYESRVEEVPLNVLGGTTEFGAAVVFLSSPLSGFINGAALPIDGGSLGSNV